MHDKEVVKVILNGRVFYKNKLYHLSSNLKDKELAGSSIWIENKVWRQGKAWLLVSQVGDVNQQCLVEPEFVIDN